jgi:hypothetical protein
MHQFGISVLFVYALEWAKKQSWLPMSWNTDTLNRNLSLIVAFLTSCGIVFIASPHGWMNGGTIQIPPMQQILDTLIHAVGQVGMQQGYYHVIVKGVSPPTIGQIGRAVDKAVVDNQ